MLLAPSVGIAAPREARCPPVIATLATTSPAAASAPNAARDVHFLLGLPEKSADLSSPTMSLLWRSVGATRENHPPGALRSQARRSFDQKNGGALTTPVLRRARRIGFGAKSIYR
jgi:hypothetical protein